MCRLQVVHSARQIFIALTIAMYSIKHAWKQYFTAAPLQLHHLGGSTASLRRWTGQLATACFWQKVN